jgi:hypothetical protein
MPSAAFVLYQPAHVSVAIRRSIDDASEIAATAVALDRGLVQLVGPARLRLAPFLHALEMPLY